MSHEYEYQCRTLEEMMSKAKTWRFRINCRRNLPSCRLCGQAQIWERWDARSILALIDGQVGGDKIMNNTMLLCMQNMLAHLEIISAAQVRR